MRMKEFAFNDLFYSQNGDTDLKKEDLTTFGEYLITSGLENSGVAGKTNKKAKVTPENTITIDMFGNAFYRDFPYKMVTHARVFALLPLIKMNREIGLYLTSLMSFLPDVFSYNNMCSWVKIQDMELSLPVKSVISPDYDLIENLIGGGIDMSKIDTSTWEEFSLDELFDVITTRSQNKNAITFDDNGIYEFIGRSSINYGIQGHLNRQEYDPNPANVFSLVQVGESVCLYRENEWYASQNIFMLKPKDDRICASHSFFEALINKQLSIYKTAYEYPCLEDVKKMKILLPYKETEEIDYNFMEKYIRAIEKQTIAKIYEGRGKVIEKTKEIVAAH